MRRASTPAGRVTVLGVSEAVALTVPSPRWPSEPKPHDDTLPLLRRTTMKPSAAVALREAATSANAVLGAATAVLTTLSVAAALEADAALRSW